MTKDQKHILDQKDESGLRSTISTLMATNHKDKDELIAYCERRLYFLNVDAAMVEDAEMKPGEFFQ